MGDMWSALANGDDYKYQDDKPKLKLWNCQIKKIPEEFHKVYFYEILIGEVNYLQFLDLRVQIKNTQEAGYFIEFDGEKIEIDKNGNLKKWPYGLFEQVEKYLMQLI